MSKVIKPGFMMKTVKNAIGYGGLAGKNFAGPQKKCTEKNYGALTNYYQTNYKKT